jgi:hypothetical protein
MLMIAFEDEIFTEGTQDWEEVLHRRDNPNMTRFKAMSMDEQVETIEKTTQEALRVREENRAVEATEARGGGCCYWKKPKEIYKG